MGIEAYTDHVNGEENDSNEKNGLDFDPKKNYVEEEIEKKEDTEKNKEGEWIDGNHRRADQTEVREDRFRKAA